MVIFELTCWRLEYSDISVLDATIHCFHQLLLNLIRFIRVMEILRDIISAVIVQRHVDKTAAPFLINSSNAQDISILAVLSDDKCTR